MAPGKGLGSFLTSTTALSYLTPPPDLSQVPADVVVPFKNLLKRDSTTKAKALEEIIGYVKEHPFESGGPEESILESWVEFYPRTSIDNSRRVRELSHALQFELMKSARKRMEKRIPWLVGTWMAGTFDRDKVVARAATDGFAPFLNTEKKVRQFWIKCQTQILEYATEAVKESVDSLSDERSTSKEDAEAKFYRVMGGSLSLVLHLLERVDSERLREEELDSFLALDAVWRLAAVRDSFVRRTVYQLLQLCLDKRPVTVQSQLPLIGRVLVNDSLTISQTGSAHELVKVLTELTQRFPEIWGGKKQPLDRLRPFVEKGSQACSWEYWQDMDRLLRILPQQDISPEAASRFLKAMRSGLSSREEARANAGRAWECYLDLCDRLMCKMNADVTFVQENVYPMTRQYLHPTSELSSWKTCSQPRLLGRAWTMVVSQSDPDWRNSAESEWQELSESFLARMAVSLPEGSEGSEASGASKDYNKSQEALVAQGDRWFDVAAAIREHRGSEEAGTKEKAGQVQSIVTASSLQVLRGALDLLSSRKYIPYGAAAIIQAALEKCPDLPGLGGIITSLLFPSKPAEIRTLLASPSMPRLVACVNLLGRSDEVRYKEAWQVLTDVALQSEHVPQAALASLLSSQTATPLSQQHASLQQFLLVNCLDCASGKDDPSAWRLFDTALTYDSLGRHQARKLVDGVLGKLGRDESLQAALKSLELMVEKRTEWLLGEEVHLELVSRLLSLAEMPDRAIASKAAAIHTLLDKQSTAKPLVGIIRENLEAVGPQSLSIESLVRQASSILAAIPTCETGAVQDLFPSSNIWMEELAPFLQHIPNPSLSLTSSFGGAYLLVNKRAPAEKQAGRDGKGRSVPARMAIYTAGLLQLDMPSSLLPLDFRVELVFLLFLTAQLAIDQLVLAESGGLWDSLDEIGSGEVEDFILSSRNIMTRIVSDSAGWKEEEVDGSSLVARLTTVMLQQTRDFSPVALYSAKALSELLQALVAKYGVPANLEDRLGKLGLMKASPQTIFAAVAFLTGYGDVFALSESGRKFCNRLVSELVGAFPGLARTLYTLVALNACLSIYGLGEVPVENRRQVFALKQMTSWTDTPEEMSTELAAETCKAIYRILPTVKHIYGPYWEQTVEYCIRLWNHAGRHPPNVRLPYLYSSLKLMLALDACTDANEEVAEAMNTYAEARSQALLGLLKIPWDADSQPARIVHSLLCRTAVKIPLEHLADVSDLYGLVASDSQAIQTAAFALLHKTLPLAQEKVSVDVLLDKTDARLPDELLSLLSDAPTLDSYPDHVPLVFPTPVRSYLLAWHLVFDVYRAASFKVRNDYTEYLKAENSVGPLMDFMFDLLGHSAAQALNLEKEGFGPASIRFYDLKVADTEPDERNMHWLLVHLFYLTVKYMPGLFKAWYLDCRSKQTKIAVGSWTSRYFSPIIIDEALDEVVQWADEQDKASRTEGEKELHIRVSKLAREVTAGYEVDEDMATISIKIPPSYPLEGVSVVSVNRVAVSERKWQSWLMTTQAVITFANGSLIDGLTTFRRNIVGALKGQTECAICYSIVSSDKRMPDKRCGTCRNLFHRICLYKWFQSSNQNKCPLCRNPIDYLGSDTQARRR